MKFKYGIGPMSKNVVDACISYTNTYDVELIFIPSRRQVDYNGGYVNGWNTKTFSAYVRSRTDKIILKRDHGGPNQGYVNDDGIESLEYDCIHFDAIHIDPWKTCISLKEGITKTIDLIRFCNSKNPSLRFEIGTEQSIFEYSANELDEMITALKNTLTYAQFDRVKFAVIQSGTSLHETINTGSYDKQRLLDMIAVCIRHNLLSKEHNGDYLPVELIHEKFSYGLSSLNIAPEFGGIETKTLLKECLYSSRFDVFFDICNRSDKWKKWVKSDFDPYENKEKLINICGHYILSYPEFISKIKNNIRVDIDDIIQHNIFNKLNELHQL